MSLTFTEFCSVQSLEDLLSIYLEKGHVFRDEKSLLDRIHHDWTNALKPVHHESLKTEKVILTPRIVKTGGVEYRLFGINHVDTHAHLWREAFQNSFSGMWFCEQNLSHFTSSKNIIEIPDHRVISSSKLFYAGMKAVHNALNDFLPWRVDDGKMQMKVNAIPEEALNFDYPVYVSRRNYELYRKDTMSDLIKCSIFMAEFMRFYNNSSVKNLICGRAHSCYIEQYLLQRSNDRGIITVAKECASQDRSMQRYQLKELALPLLGAASALTATIGGVYGVIHIVKTMIDFVR